MFSGRKGHPRSPSTMDLRVYRTREIVMYSKFHRNPFKGLGPRGVEICRLLSAYTTARTTLHAVVVVSTLCLKKMGHAHCAA